MQSFAMSQPNMPEQTLILLENGDLNDITPTGFYNFSIPEAGWYRFRVNITGDIDVDVLIYMEQKTYSYYFDKDMGEYSLIDADYFVDKDNPYDQTLWIESPGVGFIYVTRDHGDSGTFSASVTAVKKISQASALHTGENSLTISKESAYIGNFTVSGYTKLYNFTVTQLIPALSLTTIIKKAWIQINSITGVNASYPVNITYIEDGTKEHSIGQITQNVSLGDDPLKFYFNVNYLNFTYDSLNANKLKFNTTNPSNVLLFDADVMIEDADGDEISLYNFPFLFAIISSAVDYVTSFNLYDKSLDLDIGATGIGIADPFGFYGYEIIYTQNIPVPIRKVREWISAPYNTTPNTALVPLEPQNYSYVMRGSNIITANVKLYISEANYSILSVNDTLSFEFKKEDALFPYFASHFVLLNVSGISPDKLYKIYINLSGKNWTIDSSVIHQGNYVGSGPRIKRIDTSGYVHHEDRLMKDLHFIPVSTYDSKGRPLETFILSYFLQYNDNGTYYSSSVFYNPYVANPSRGTLMLFFYGFAYNTSSINSSETATITVNFTATGNVEQIELGTTKQYTIPGNTSGYKVLKLTTKPGYEYNITISGKPNNVARKASLTIYSTVYKENYLFALLPFGTTPMNESLSFEYVDNALFGEDKYLIIYPSEDATAVSISVSETPPTDFPSSNKAELVMGQSTPNANQKALKLSISDEAVYTISITTDPGYVGIVSIMYVTETGRFPFEYTPSFFSMLLVPGGTTSVTYEYVSKTSGTIYLLVYSSGTGTIYITITKQYLVPSFLPIPGLFLVGALPIALILGFAFGWMIKRPSKPKAKAKTKPTKKSKKKK